MTCGIKICGLFREFDIQYVNEARPDYAGFILLFPQSHRNIHPEWAAELKKALRPEIRSVGVFVDQPQEAVLSAADVAGLDVIQLHGHEDEAYIRELKKKTARPVWKAFHIRTKENVRAAEESSADEILLDNGYGTGQSFDWSLLSEISRPFCLAGGLTPENIPEAIRLFSPKLVDISSGVETAGLKDREKIRRAVKAVRSYSRDGM